MVWKMATELQKECRELTTYIFQQERLPSHCFIRWKDVKAGYAHNRTDLRTPYITMPIWVLSQGTEYAWAYMIHEVCHFIVWYNWPGAKAHGDLFKKYERKWLGEFGLVPVYARAYVKELRSAAGQTLWRKLL